MKAKLRIFQKVCSLFSKKHTKTNQAISTYELTSGVRTELIPTTKNILQIKVVDPIEVTSATFKPFISESKVK